MFELSFRRRKSRGSKFSDQTGAPASESGPGRWWAAIAAALWTKRRGAAPKGDKNPPENDLQISVNLDDSFGKIKDEDKC